MMRVIPVRVLVIDDDDAVCRQLSTWLTEAAYDVVTFTDPAVGLAHVKKAAGQIALVDLHLPDTDAVELMRALGRAAPRMRVLALAAFPEAAQLIAAVRAGARDILEKPIQSSALLAAIERQLVALGVCVRSEEEYNRRVGARVRAARAAVNLTLNDVAGACGLSATQLSHIELGKTATTTWSLARICSALRTTPTALLEDL